MIKIIYGMRRSGKSVILNQIKDELLNNGIKEENIIYINFESLSQVMVVLKIVVIQKQSFISYL